MPSCRLVTDPNDPHTLGAEPAWFYLQARQKLITGRGSLLSVMQQNAADFGTRPLWWVALSGAEILHSAQAKLWPHAQSCAEGDLLSNGLSGGCSASQNITSEPQQPPQLVSETRANSFFPSPVLTMKLTRRLACNDATLIFSLLAASSMDNGVGNKWGSLLRDVDTDASFSCVLNSKVQPSG